MTKSMPEASFWKGRRVLITSPASFLGSWTALVLHQLGAQVFGFGEAASTVPNLFDLANLAQNISMTYGDIRDEMSLRQIMDFAQAEVIFHLGESSLLKEAEKKPVDFFSKSVLGTAVLMELLRETASVRAVVVASSDKVYERDTENNNISEEAKVAAKEILPTAKLCSELVALSYRNSFFNPHKYNKHKIAIATARMGAAMGGGDFTEGSLIPRAMQSFCARNTFKVRNPNSVRPWIHVLDQVAGILLLAESLIKKGPKNSATYNLGAQEQASVAEVMAMLKEVLGADFSWVAEESQQNASASIHGQLNCEKAKQDLGWEPHWNLKKSLATTAQWYLDYDSKKLTAADWANSVNQFLAQEPK